MDKKNKYLISIVGPTAVGKTAMAITLAKHYKTAVISADSRQFYKEISIGTAKPTATELSEVPHYFINNKSVSETYSAGDFERDALKLLANLFEINDIVILVGGSGLYIKALWEGLDEMPEADEELRKELIENFNIHGVAYLQKKLNDLNSEKLLIIDNQNPQRLMRAIEIELQRNTFSTIKLKEPRPFEVLKICLNKERSKLYDIINKRVDLMMEQGLLKECELLIEFKEKYALKTVGYTEIFDFFEGHYSLPKAIELIKQHTRNYAKRQITWFKREQEMQWFEPNETLEIIEFIHKKTGH